MGTESGIDWFPGIPDPRLPWRGSQTPVDPRLPWIPDSRGSQTPVELFISLRSQKIPSHTGNLSAGGRQNKVSSGEWMLYGEIASIRRFYWEMVFDCCLKVISSKNQENSANQNGSLEQVGASRSMRTWIFFIIINTKNSISTNWGHFKMLQTQNWFV
jgi:hypothetical protein